MRNYPIVVLALLATLFCLPPPTNAQQDTNIHMSQIDTTNYPEVTLYISVTDGNGNPITRLTQDDFSITEDGTAVAIQSFQGGGQHHIATALVIDHSGSMRDRQKMQGAKDAAQSFVDQMHTGDQTTIIGFSEESTTLQPLTDDTVALDQAIDRLYPSGGTALYDSVIAGVDSLKDTSNRKVLLLLTDGKDCREPNKCPKEAGSSHTLEEAIAYANDYEQPIYVVGLGEKNRGKDDDDGIDETVLRRMADETGGRYFYAPDASELAALYDSLAGAIHEEYMMTYHSPRPFYDGTRRDIQVNVGGTSSSSTYTEQHLINVKSNLLVGVLMLLPLLLLLAMPTVVQRVRKQPGTPVSPHNVPVDDEDVAEDEPSTYTTASQTTSHTHTTTGNSSTYTTPPPTPPEQPTQVACVSCGKPIRPNAKFCGGCGTRQPERNQ
jgi:VWFA-related protein